MRKGCGIVLWGNNPVPEHINRKPQTKEFITRTQHNFVIVALLLLYMLLQMCFQNNQNLQELATEQTVIISEKRWVSQAVMKFHIRKGFFYVHMNWFAA